VRVHLGSIKPDDVQVEIYADAPGSDLPFRAQIALDHAVPDAAGTYEFSGGVPSDRPAADYTPRVVPRRGGVSIPLEMALIAWQK